MKKKEILRIGDRYYFSLVAKITLTFLILALYFLISLPKNETIFIFLGIIISPSIPAIWMSRYVTEINKESGYSRYVWVLGKKLMVNSIKEVPDSISLKAIDQYPGLYGIYLNFRKAQPKAVITGYEIDPLTAKAKKIEEKLGLKLIME